MFNDFIMCIFLLISYIFLIVLYLYFKQLGKNYLKIDLKTYINYYILMNYQYIMLIICLFFVYVIIIRLGLLGEVVISGCTSIVAQDEIIKQINDYYTILDKIPHMKVGEMLRYFEDLCIKLNTTCDKLNTSLFNYYENISMIETAKRGPIFIESTHNEIRLICVQMVIVNKIDRQLSGMFLTENEYNSYMLLRPNFQSIDYKNLSDYICAYNNFIRKFNYHIKTSYVEYNEYNGAWSCFKHFYFLQAHLNEILIKNKLEPFHFNSVNDENITSFFNKFSSVLKLNILDEKDRIVLMRWLLFFYDICGNEKEDLSRYPGRAINLDLHLNYLTNLQTKLSYIMSEYRTSLLSNTIVEENVVNNSFNNSSMLSDANSAIPIVDENVVNNLSSNVLNNVSNVFNDSNDSNDSNMPNNSNVSKNVASDASLLSRIINNHILGPYSITWSCAIWTVVGLVILNSYL